MEIHCTESALANLRGKVVVLTGGAQGIGAATVALAYHAGAHVFFGDWEENKGQQVEQSLKAEPNSNYGTVHFQRLDVRDYNSQLALFDAAYKEHNRVDYAISCAAVGEPMGWFEPKNVNMETIRQEPFPLKERIDINLTSVLLFSRIALAFMKTENRDPSSAPKAIVLVSSIAGITEAPGLFSYSAGKHGVIGLMRALRPSAPSQYGVRANAICPWATDTQLLGGIKDKWVEEKLPLNSPGDVGRIILQCAADPALNGKAVFVTGGRGFDTEEGIDKTLPLWMGAQNSIDFLRGQEVLGNGDDWAIEDKVPASGGTK